MNKFVLVFITIVVILSSIVLLTDRGSQFNTPNNGKLQIVTSFYPMYFFTQQVGGDKVQVSNITPVGAEPHDYEPTTQEIARISHANMLVLNGENLEPWGEKIKDQLKGSSVLTVTAGEGLANQKFEEEGKIIKDPHVWLDPVLARIEVENIEKGFEKVDPGNTTYYRNNAQKLLLELDNLDKEYRDGLSSCQKKDFVTSHAAFGYLSNQYNINQVPISGVSPDEESSPKKLAAIAELVKKENIKIIFFESLVSPKLSQTIANETGAKTAVLDPIEGISFDAQKAGQTYFTVMRNNLSALKEALQCSK